MFVRFAGLRHFHGIDIPDDCGRVRAWREVLLKDPAVVRTAPPEAKLLEAYGFYLDVLAKAAKAGIEVPVAKGD